MKTKEEIEKKIAELATEKNYMRECVINNNGDVSAMKQAIVDNLQAMFWLRWVLKK